MYTSNSGARISPAHAWRARLTLALILALYVVFRVMTLPRDPLHAWGFRHDAAYLAIVAQNLHAGKGFVLDALWLVSLQPARLPMPYDNANPLFPAMTAGAMGLFGVDAVPAGFLISALSSAGLLLALFFLLKRYDPDPYAAFGVAGLVALFPPVWEHSWAAITDEMWVMFMVAFLAALVRSDKLGMAALAGGFFGLAWLVRAAAITVVPALVLWLLLTHGWRKALSRLALLGITAAAISSPWLIHNAKTFGSPFHSENGPAMNAQVQAWQRNEGMVRVSHWPTPAPPYASVLKEHPGAFIAHCIKTAVSTLLRALISSSTDSSYAALALLTALSLLMLSLSPRVLRTPGFISVLVYAASFIALLSIGAETAEGRYFILLQTLFAAWLLVSVYRTWSDFRQGRRGWVRLSAILLAAGYLFVLLPRSDWRLARFWNSTSAENLEYMQAAQTVNRTITGGNPVIVGDHPYYYTVSTGAQSLTIPESGDQYLLEYMQKYHARFIFLSEEERTFWKPSWKSGNALPRGIRLVDTPLRGYCVYQTD
jgi:4-amino-4-deoxy-L-arabinose transferase-like glycosyltransferase